MSVARPLVINGKVNLSSIVPFNQEAWKQPRDWSAWQCHAQELTSGEPLSSAQSHCKSILWGGGFEKIWKTTPFSDCNDRKAWLYPDEWNFAARTIWSLGHRRLLIHQRITRGFGCENKPERPMFQLDEKKHKKRQVQLWRGVNINYDRWSCTLGIL